MGRKAKLKNKGGRPRKEIDYALVERLAKIHCTQEEIAEILSLSLNKLKNDKEFMAVYKKGINNAKMSLRRKQWAAVNKGNISMMIWLGKQYLQQREPQNNAILMDVKELPDFENRTDAEIDQIISTYQKKNGNGNGH